MHKIISDRPYHFFPPYHGNIWPRFLRSFSAIRLKRKFGISKVEFEGLEKLKAHIGSKHGIVIAPNHSHPADPFVIVDVLKNIDTSPYIMASWHLFLRSKITAFLLRRGGVFSVYREGIDRKALSAAIDILISGDRPLVIFPEGVISRHNEILNPIQEGIEFIAKNALKKKVKLDENAKVLIFPVTIKYVFQGDLIQSTSKILKDIEKRLSWREQSHLEIKDRIMKIGDALLSLKEVEYLGEAQKGSLAERTSTLANFILTPIEEEWLKEKPSNGIVARVKKLRIAILPGLVEGDLSESEIKRRWRLLEDLYFAQVLHCFPPNYVKDSPTVDRMLETIEKFEEALSDKTTIHRSRKAVIKFSDPIELTPSNADPERVKKLLAENISNNLKCFGETK